MNPICSNEKVKIKDMGYLYGRIVLASWLKK